MLWNQMPNRGQRFRHGLRRVGIIRSSGCCVPLAREPECSIPVATRFRNQRRDLNLRISRGDKTAIELFSLFTPAAASVPGEGVP
jgi:hypothetical protein